MAKENTESVSYTQRFILCFGIKVKVRRKIYPWSFVRTSAGEELLREKWSKDSLRCSGFFFPSYTLQIHTGFRIKEELLIWY